MTRLGIGLPVFNGERFVAEALRSILSQTWTEFELVISDNASTDRTPEICQDLAAGDPRVRYVRNETNVGAARNFNDLFARCQGEYFKWAAADDILEPGYLERCLAELEARPDLVLCHSHSSKIDEHGEIVGRYEFSMRLDSPDVGERFHDLIMVRHPCITVFGVARREVLARTPLIGAYVGSDRVLLAELALHGKLYEIPEPLFRRRSHREASVYLDEYSDRLAWFDPHLHGVIHYPNWRILEEYWRAIGRAPLGAAERWRCHRELLGHARQRSRFLRRDLRIAAKMRLSRSTGGRRVLDALKHLTRPGRAA